MAYLLLAAFQLGGLLMIPFGWPGVWIQLGALAVFAWYTEFAVVGTIPIAILVALALTAEVAALVLARGGADERLRRRVGFGGLAGGGAGAALGVPLPLLGSMYGALLGAITGVFLGSLRTDGEGRSCAALGGLLFAAALRTAAGIVVAVFTALILLR